MRLIGRAGDDRLLATAGCRVEPATAGPILDAVKARGSLVCGIGTGTAGFMHARQPGQVERPLGRRLPRRRRAIFGDADKVKYVPLTSPAALHRRCSRARSTC